MDCHYTNNTSVCLNYGEQMCDILHEKKLLEFSPNYFDCMKDVYEQNYGANSLQFCQLVFGNSTKMYSQTDKLDESFPDDMLNCYSKSQNTKQYCDDVFMYGYKNWTSKEELLECYE